jgi:DNA repair protein RadC
LGSLDSVQVHPRETFKTAIIRGAQAILVAHNHPSGDPSPSEGDIKATRDLIRAGQVLQIELMDHVIIGNAKFKGGFASLRKLGYFY